MRLEFWAKNCSITRPGGRAGENSTGELSPARGVAWAVAGKFFSSFLRCVQNEAWAKPVEWIAKQKSVKKEIIFFIGKIRKNKKGKESQEFLALFASIFILEPIQSFPLEKFPN